MDGRFSDRPDPEHGNPLEPVGTRDDVGKDLANAIVARFRRMFPTLRGRFLSILSTFPANPPIWRHDQNFNINFQYQEWLWFIKMNDFITFL